MLIPAKTERQALDWSLALASQQIACIIRPPTEATGWGLEVEAADASRALRTLRLYHAENRRWNDRLRPVVGDLVFHWGVLLWCFLLAMVHWAAQAPGSTLEARGIFDTAAFVRGEGWRAVTATFLHGGLDHLASNLTWGFLLLGLAMGRLGVGYALLGTLVAGSAGNGFAWLARGRDYLGLGASGVVMAALGLLAVTRAEDFRAGRLSLSELIRSLLAGVMLFILIGTAPRSDVLAHLGGFLGGMVVALILVRLPETWRKSRGLDAGAAAAYLALGGAAWALALGVGR